MRTQRDKRIWTAFDLEMNQPSNEIIQIGAVKFNIETMELYGKLRIYVKIQEKLCRDPKICDIVQLTGITDGILQEEGVSLLEAYQGLAAFHRADVEGAKGMVNPIVWGGGDSRLLRAQVEAAGHQWGNGDYYCFGNREMDMKSFHQLISMSRDKPFAGGLAKSLHKWSGQFQGRSHDATVDAYNTAKIAHIIYTEMKEKTWKSLES